MWAEIEQGTQNTQTTPDNQENMEINVVYHKPHEPPTPTLQERPEVMKVSFAKEVLQDSPNKGNIEEM